MKTNFNWETSKNSFNETVYEFDKFKIVSVAPDCKELKVNGNYIGAFSSFQKAEDVVRLIIEG